MCFTLKKILTPPTISLNGKPLPYTRHHTFLGLHLKSPRLTWASHIGYLSTSCMRQLNDMKRIASIWWEGHGNLLRMLAAMYRRLLLLTDGVAMSSGCRDDQGRAARLTLADGRTMRREAQQPGAVGQGMMCAV
ncbi:hypothetical protein E2C01_042463 [Portunus trituberculatus]|uniref:Uncharacterized protein n=1 Tax=Portunus trituberculatus TaxID=210409 RepID=A0A5B7FQA9_PORTR|nr:hypothetical protein [Portunus trituberculatus]